MCALPNSRPSILPVGNSHPLVLTPKSPYSSSLLLKPRSLGSQPPSGLFCLSGTLPSPNTFCLYSHYPEVWALKLLFPQTQESRAPVSTFHSSESDSCCCVREKVGDRWHLPSGSGRDHLLLLLTRRHSPGTCFCQSARRCPTRPRSPRALRRSEPGNPKVRPAPVPPSPCSCPFSESQARLLSPPPRFTGSQHAPKRGLRLVRRSLRPPA